MKLTQYDLSKVRKHYQKSDILKLLEEFVASDMVCARVDDYDGPSKPDIFASTLRAAIKRYNFGNITATSQGGSVYLIKTNK